MAIYKTDGSNFNLLGSMQTYPIKQADTELFDRLDREQIKICGSEVIYYKSFLDTNYDELYMEASDIITSQEGYHIYSQFTPIRPTQPHTIFGIDSPDEMIFNFNLTEWKETIGELPKLKSLIYCKWDFGSVWEIIENNISEPYKIWKKYRLQVVTKKYQPSRSERHPTRRDSEDVSLNKINIY